jgi:hypothetical protein
MTHTVVGISTDDRATPTPAVPAFLRDTYTWAYLTPTSLAVFDHPLIIDLILWGSARPPREPGARRDGAGTTGASGGLRLW